MYTSTKILAALFVFSILSFSGSAQFKKERNIFRMGLRNVDMTGIDAGTRSFAPAIDLGFGASYYLSGNIKFEPELHYSPRGFSSTTKYTDSTNTKSSLYIHYLDFCPNFSFIFGSKAKKGGVPINFWVGPYLGYGFAGSLNSDKLTINPRTNKADTTISTSASPFSSGVKRLDYGINAGIGLRFDNFVNFGITYSRGFNDLADDKRYGTTGIYNQSYGFYVSVLFDDVF